jgi:hypothetical protein
MGANTPHAKRLSEKEPGMSLLWSVSGNEMSSECGIGPEERIKELHHRDT